MFEKLSVYIHVPFCIKKCVYCDFYSDTRLSLIPEYIACLAKEMALRSEKGQGRMIDTVYLGGGTPSVLKIHQVEALLEGLRENFTVSSDAEISVEVNPGTVDEKYLASLKDIGINRLSIGTQSFNTDKLFFLKRIHSVEQSIDAVEYAQKAGFDNISLDLIYGLPFETEKIWRDDLKTAIQMRPSHLSCYMLTIEPGTPLEKKIRNKQIPSVNSDVLLNLFEKTSNILEDSGYEHYEISNFSLDSKKRSKHNSGYWNMKPYLGFGPAAHSYDQNVRSWNVRDITAYIRALGLGNLPVEDTETLVTAQKMLEMILLKLRTLEGIDFKEFRCEFGMSFETQFEQIIDQVCFESLGKIEDNRFFLTLEGKTRLDNIIEAFSEKIL